MSGSGFTSLLGTLPVCDTSSQCWASGVFSGYYSFLPPPPQSLTHSTKSPQNESTFLLNKPTIILNFSRNISSFQISLSLMYLISEKLTRFVLSVPISAELLYDRNRSCKARHLTISLQKFSFLATLRLYHIVNAQSVFYSLSKFLYVEQFRNMYILSLKTVTDFIFIFAECRIRIENVNVSLQLTESTFCKLKVCFLLGMS